MVSLALSFALAAGEANLPGSAARMQAAIEKQRASVRRQAPGSTSGFFTTGWLDSGPEEAAAVVNAPCEPVSTDQLNKLVTETANREGVSSKLLHAMIARESAGRPCAVSAKGAEGLMQLMPGTASDLGVQNSFDAAENISGGARYLKQLLDRYKGDLRLALAAYNAGPQRVDDVRGVPAIAETQAYVSAIMSEVNDPEEAAR
jgi:soluble lytic murein transglycosylase-like protein